MPKFIVYLTTTSSTSVEVEAEDRADAEEKAYEQDMPTICAQCSGWGRSTHLELGNVWEISEVCDEAGNVVED